MRTVLRAEGQLETEQALHVNVHLLSVGKI